ncbi:MAG TPA: hypothetical protein VFR02_07200 [bacterium]|nr:hypothetical protein [bacterium]
MKLISPKFHGYLDYLVVAVFAAAPSFFHFSMLPMAVSYALAVIHLALTLLTDFPLGAFKVVPLPWHGIIEMVVGPCLAALPFAFGMTAEPDAEYFYVAAGAVIFLAWSLTDYGRK